MNWPHQETLFLAPRKKITKIWQNIIKTKPSFTAFHVVLSTGGESEASVISGDVEFS